MIVYIKFENNYFKLSFELLLRKKNVSYYMQLTFRQNLLTLSILQEHKEYHFLTPFSYLKKKNIPVEHFIKKG